MFNLRAFSATAVLSVAGLLLLTGPLAAAPQAPAVAVQSGDLNLTSDAGRAVLRQRIAHAVEKVCGPTHPRTTGDAQAYATCKQAAQVKAGVQYDSVIATAGTETKVAGAIPAKRSAQ
jgi:UrcA family protein